MFELNVLDAISNTTNTGEVNELGRALMKFRAIQPNLAKSIIASYYYHCKNDVINMVLIAMEIDGRIDNLFDKYMNRDKRLSEQDIRREKEAYEKKQKSFYHHNGDYFTFLNVYNALKRHVDSFKPESFKPKKNTESFMNFFNNNFFNANQTGGENNINISIPINTNSKGVKYEKIAKAWCKENGISSRTFVNRKGNWNKIGENARKINDTLMKIVRPAHLRKEHFDMYKKDGAVESMGQLNRQIKNEKNMIVDLDLSNDELLETVKVNNLILQGGGYESKPYEINLFPNATEMNSRDKNILMALSLGNMCNMAKLVEPSRNIYKTCFPIKKMLCNFDRNTTLSQHHKSPIVIYYDLFTLNKDAKTMKLNIVTKITEDIITKIKKDYKNKIPSCFEKEELKRNELGQGKGRGQGRGRGQGKGKGKPKTKVAKSSRKSKFT